MKVPLSGLHPRPPKANQCWKAPRVVSSIVLSAAPPVVLEVEPDQRHVDLIIKDLDLESANEVITPGEKDPKGKAVEQDVELGPEDTTRYRAIVARANYLAADRPDLMCAVPRNGKPHHSHVAPPQTVGAVLGGE